MIFIFVIATVTEHLYVLGPIVGVLYTFSLIFPVIHQVDFFSRKETRLRTGISLAQGHRAVNSILNGAAWNFIQVYEVWKPTLFSPCYGPQVFVELFYRRNFH